MIQIYNRQKDLPLSKNSVKILAQTLLTHLKAPSDQVSLYFVTQKQIAKLHEEFFQDPTPTDCISFPIDEIHLGEIFVCPAVALQYAKKRHLDPYEETALYVAHGLLHLLGYDDLNLSDRRIMRKKEKSCMRHLKETKVALTPP